MSQIESVVRLYVVGGFLGAGKTTALTALVAHFIRQKQRVAVITNDRTDGLVDSDVMQSLGINYREISGACICARFRDFLSAADALLEKHQPHVILAEPVGSAADLVSTVIRPLRAYTQNRYTIMPLTVLADPVRVCEMLGDEHESDEGGAWPEDIKKLYDMQLSEADRILLTKADAVADDIVEKSHEILKKLYAIQKPSLGIQSFSAVTGDGLVEWLQALDDYDGAESTHIEKTDYDLSLAESALGWLNLEIKLVSQNKDQDADDRLDAVALIQGFFHRLHDLMKGTPIGHLKLFASINNQLLKANVVDWRRGYQIENLNAAESDVCGQWKESRIRINLRAVMDHNQLKQIAIDSVSEAAGFQNNTVEVIQALSVKPDRPKPVYRL